MSVKSLIASVRTRVGKIKNANNSPSANSWLQIEAACDQLLAEIDTYERAPSSVCSHQHITKEADRG